MPSRRTRTPSQGSTRQARLDRAAGEVWKEAAKTASVGAGALEDAANAVAVGEALDSAGQIMLASGVQDLTRAADLQTVANRVASLSQIVAESGAADIAQGAEMLVAADDVETVSAVVGVMSLADLDRGMELARVSGELQVASRIVDKLQMPLLSTFLDDRSGKLGKMAVDNILLASATRALAAGMAATGQKLEDLSATEVAEGIVRLAASGALAVRSDELAAESGDSAASGYDKLNAAEEFENAAGRARSEAIDASALGGAALGVAAAEATLADSLVDQASR